MRSLNGHPQNIPLNLMLEISRGKIEGVSHVHQVGENNTVALTGETIWDGGGDYTGFLTTGTTLSCVSTDDEDGGAGTDTGGLVMDIYGLNELWVEAIVRVTLNGTTPVLTTDQFIRVHKVKLVSAGSNQRNIGTITVTSTGAGTPVMAVMLPETGNTLMAITTVPLNKRGYVMNWGGAINKKQAGSADFHLHCISDPINGRVKSIDDILTVNSLGTGTVSHPHVIPEGFAAKTDIYVSGHPSDVNSDLSAFFEIIFVAEGSF